MDLIELPRYRCHKEVHALKISHVLPNPRGIELHFSDTRYCPIEQSNAWFDKHKPEVGGYFVWYADGYKSYSPAAAFEEGYSLINYGDEAL